MDAWATFLVAAAVIALIWLQGARRRRIIERNKADGTGNRMTPGVWVAIGVTAVAFVVFVIVIPLLAP